MMLHDKFLLRTKGSPPIVRQLHLEVCIRGERAGTISDFDSVSIFVAPEQSSVLARYLNTFSEQRKFVIPLFDLQKRFDVYDSEFPLQWGDPVH